MDTEGDYWFLTASDKLIRQHQTVNSVFIDKVSLLSKTDDLLYDLAVVNDRLYLFYKSGTMICFDIETAKELYRESPLEQKKIGFIPIQSMLFPTSSTSIKFVMDIQEKELYTVLTPKAGNGTKY